MTARKVFSIVVMVLLVYLLVNMFLPLLGSSYSEISLWEYFENQNDDPLKFIVIIELVAAMLVCLLQIVGVLQDAKFAYFTIGYQVTLYVDLFFNLLDKEVLDYAKVGFWAGLIVSFLALIMLIIGSLVNNKKKARPQYSNVGAISGYDPKTGAPIYAKPEKKGEITGYDPKTGEPIYAKPAEKKNEKITGYDPKTGEPIYAKPVGYDPHTGEPIYK